MQTTSSLCSRLAKVLVRPGVAQSSSPICAPSHADRRGSLRLATVAVLTLVLIVVKSAFAQSQPDIIVILTDDQPYHMVQHIASIQSLIGDQGVRFTNAYVSTPLCCPSRTSFLTGLFSHNTGVFNNTAPDGGVSAFDDSKSLATVLSNAGYRTLLSGKYLNGYMEGTGPFVPPGWTDWFAQKGHIKFGFDISNNGTIVHPGNKSYSTDVLGQRVVDFIRTTPVGTPIFAYFAPPSPHKPNKPAAQDAGTLNGIPRYRPPNFNEADISDKPQWLRRALLTPTQIAALDAQYQAMQECMLSIDRWAKRIVDALAETGRLDNAVLIYYSDNGYSLGAHRWRFKNCAYEECTRTPLMIRAPGAIPRMEDALVTNEDITATIVELAGTSMGQVNGHGPNGVSLVPLLADPGTPWRTALLLELVVSDDGKPPAWYAVRTTDWKYVELATGEKELYNMISDPFELRNVAKDPANAGIVATLKAQLEELKAQ